MFEERARILDLDIAPGRRILAVSDIHANLPYFRGLLEKCGFCGDDELIVVGDFLEKGEKSLDTLRFLMELSRGGNVHALCGNCDTWYEIFTMGEEGYAIGVGVDDTASQTDAGYWSLTADATDAEAILGIPQSTMQNEE